MGRRGRRGGERGEAAGEQWVGLKNYVNAFADDRFWASTWHTIGYIVVTVPLSLVVGLGLALLANQPFRVKWPVRLGLLLPWWLARSGRDPALGSGPIATIVQDVLSLLVYLAVVRAFGL